MDVEIKGLLLSADIRQLEEVHHDYAQQLEELLQKPYLSEEEKLEETRLKKIKLRLKDRMTELRHQQPVLNMA